MCEEVIGDVPRPTPPDGPRSSPACPAANRAAAAVFNAANSTSSCAEPICSIDREPRRQDHTICTAVAPDAVFTVRTKAISAAYGPALVFKFRRIRTPKQKVNPFAATPEPET